MFPKLTEGFEKRCRVHGAVQPLTLSLIRTVRSEQETNNQTHAYL